MAAVYLPNDFYFWLADNSQLVKYLTIDTFPSTLSNEEKLSKEMQIKKWRKQTLERLNQFQTTDIKDGSLEDRIYVQKPNFYSEKYFTFLYHQFKFIQSELRMLLHSNYEHSVLMCQDIIDLLSSKSLLPPNIDLFVDEEEILQALSQKPEELDRLSACEQQMALIFASQKTNTTSPNKKLLRQKILHLIDETKPMMLDNMKYFPLNSLQDEFESFIMTDNSPIKENIVSFINSFDKLEKQEFTNKALEIFNKMQNDLNINDPCDLSILILYFIRAIFNFAQNENPMYFHIPSQTHLSDIILDIKCNSLSPPEKLIKYNENDNVYDVFINDPFYKQCSEYFINLCFQTNPIDALHELSEVQTLIASSASNNESSVLPFETSFSLLMGSLIASGAPLYEDIASFIITFAPQQGLCPELEYALATATASLRYCSILYNSYK